MSKVKLLLKKRFHVNPEDRAPRASTLPVPSPSRTLSSSLFSGKVHNYLMDFILLIFPVYSQIQMAGDFKELKLSSSSKAQLTLELTIERLSSRSAGSVLQSNG